MRKIACVGVCLGLTVTAIACGNGGGSSSEESSPLAQALAAAAVEELAAAAAEAEASTKAVPQGPVWRTSFLGQEVTEPLVSKSLAAGGLAGLTIEAPEGARVEDWLGSVSVSNDMGFSVWVSSKRFNMDRQKRTIQRSDRFVKMVREDDAHFVYEARNLTDEGTHYHFESRVEVGNRTFKCMSNTGAQFRELDLIEQMLSACRTLAAENTVATAPGAAG